MKPRANGYSEARPTSSSTGAEDRAPRCWYAMPPGHSRAAAGGQEAGGEDEEDPMMTIEFRRSCGRRAVMASALVGASVSLWATVAYTSEGTGRKSGVRAGEGVGMYTDPSTANQASTFTINRRLVSCGVGAENLAGIGRFEMLMYSTQIKRYVIDSDRKEITAQGEMRSITRGGGAVLEDVRHRFIAHALDLDGDEGQPRRDRFDVHFKTAF